MFTFQDLMDTETRIQGDIIIKAHDDMMNFLEAVEVRETEGLAYYDVPKEFLEMEVEYIFYDKQTEMLVIEISKQ